MQRQTRNAAQASWEAREAAKAAGYPEVQRRVAAAVVGRDGKRRVELYSRSVDEWLDELAEEFRLDEMLEVAAEMARSTR